MGIVTMALEATVSATGCSDRCDPEAATTDAVAAAAMATCRAGKSMACAAMVAMVLWLQWGELRAKQLLVAAGSVTRLTDCCLGCLSSFIINYGNPKLPAGKRELGELFLTK